MEWGGGACNGRPGGLCNTLDAGGWVEGTLVGGARGGACVVGSEGWEVGGAGGGAWETGGGGAWETGGVECYGKNIYTCTCTCNYNNTRHCVTIIAIKTGSTCTCTSKKSSITSLIFK